MKYRFFLFVLAFLFYCSSATGQEKRVCWNFDISHGLLTNSNYSLMIDHHGRLWFGSDKGVTCYNGSTFKSYTVSDGLSDNTVIRCFEDSKGRIWFLHVNRLPSYLYKNKIYRFNSSQNEISISQTSALVELDSNTFLIGGIGGFYKLKIGGKIEKILDYPQENSLVHGIKNGQLIISQNSSNKLLHVKYPTKNIIDVIQLLTTHSLIESGAYFRSFDYFFDNKLLSEKSLKQWKNPVNDPSAFIYEIIQKKDELYVSTSKGLQVFTRYQQSWIKKETLLPSVEIVSSRHDKEGNLWLISQNKGLYFFPRLNYTYIPFPAENEFFSSINLSNNRIYLGTNNSKIYTYDLNKIHKFKDYSRFAQLPIHLFSFHHFNGYDIACANAGTYIEKDGKIIPLNGTYDCVYYPDSNFVYAPCQTGIQKIYLDAKNPRDQIMHTQLGRVRKLVILPSGLVAGCQNGIWKIENQVAIPLDRGKLANARINGLIVVNGTLFIGTGNQGLWRYEKNTLSKVFPKNLVLSEAIMGIYKGTHNTFWIHTSFGLQHVKWNGTKLMELRRLDLKTHFKSDELIGMVEGDQRLILLMNTGLFDLKLKDIPQMEKIHLFVNQFEINDQPFPYNKPIKLERNLNNLNFELGTVNYSAHPVTFYYRINKGKWVKNGSEVFSFSSLHAGSYDIEFMAKSPFYKTSILTIPRLTIKKNWWQKTVFVLSGFFLFILFIALFIFWRITLHQRKKQRFLSIELMALQSQMNPHFTFNSLNSIQSYLSSNDKRSAQIYLADFAILIRKILEQGKLHLISIDEEIEFLEQYLKLEKRRLNDSFDYTFHIGEEIDTKQLAIPTLMLQPFLENAIWHGVAGLDYRGKIDISFFIQSNALICEIRDNGLGWGKSNTKTPDTKSAGIENCRERMLLFKELFKKELLLEIVDRNGLESSGVSVRMTFPILTINS